MLRHFTKKSKFFRLFSKLVKNCQKMSKFCGVKFASYAQETWFWGRAFETQKVQKDAKIIAKSTWYLRIIRRAAMPSMPFAQSFAKWPFRRPVLKPMSHNNGTGTPNGVLFWTIWDTFQMFWIAALLCYSFFRQKSPLPLVHIKRKSHGPQSFDILRKFLIDKFIDNFIKSQKMSSFSKIS